MEEKIINDLKAGGQQQDVAIRTLYFSLGRNFKSWFRRRGLNDQDAEDVLQETMIKILTNCRSYRGSGKAKSWLWQIARNALVDRVTRTRGAALVQISRHQWDAIVQPNEDSTSRLAEICVAKALARYAAEHPERHDALSFLIEGVSLQDIAARIDRTYDATKQFVATCKKHVRPYLEPCWAMISNETGS